MEWWEFLFVLAVVMPIVVLWLGCIIDAIQRPDISGWSRLFWALAIIFFPLFGSLAYILLRPRVVLVDEPNLIDQTYRGAGGMFDVGTRVNSGFESAIDRQPESTQGR